MLMMCKICLEETSDQVGTYLDIPLYFLVGDIMAPCHLCRHQVGTYIVLGTLLAITYLPTVLLYFILSYLSQKDTDGRT